ncbi:MAG: acyltransferase family protein [Anaerolineales bacterium]|nr:acyltransferase family protein [Anaerolineales bacterium]
MKRLDQLTFTRFTAILIVLFFHGGGGIYLQAVNIFPISPILISATTSVTYLYVLSGFVMSLVYYRPNEKFDIGRYWTARFVRLYPLYLISFLLVCYYYLDSIAQIKPQKTLVNIFVLQAWVPRYAQSFNYASWFMTVQFFLYAVFPFFTLWAYRQSTKKLIWVSIIVWVVSQMIHNALWIGYFPEYENFLVYFPLFHLSSFILGAVGGIWYLREGREQKIKSSIGLLVFTGAVLFVSAYVVMSNEIAAFPHGIQLMTGLLAPVLTVVIVALALDKSRLSAFLNYPALVALGETSYGLYILHVPVIWIYKRALENLSLADPQFIFDYTFLPLMIAVGLLIHFYVDQPLRSWLKKILQRVSMPLLILDLVIVAVSIYVSFRFRFGDGREYLSYRSMGLLMFWSAFLLRTILSVVFNGLNPRILKGSFLQLLRPILISTTLGSFVLLSIIFTGYSLGWFENFPRSIFIMDWAVVLTLSLLIRFLFRRAGFYPPKPLSA